METTESLRRAVAVTEGLHSVVKNMKALAGVNIRQCERAARAIADYNRTIEMGLQIALRRLPSNLLPPKYPAGQKLGAIVFGSDHGMCGQLNDQVVSHASRALQKLSVRCVELSILAVGARAAGQLEELGRRPEARVQVPSSTLGINQAVEEVLQRTEDWHLGRGVEFVVLFHARPISGAWYRVQGTRLLPVDAEWINGLKAKKWPSKVTPMFTMDEAKLFQALIREYLFVSLYRAFAESLASENASRLASMQVAERNIEDRRRALTTEFRQVRQSSIASELLDTIASYEALQGPYR